MHTVLLARDGHLDWFGMYATEAEAISAANEWAENSAGEGFALVVPVVHQAGSME